MASNISLSKKLHFSSSFRDPADRSYALTIPSNFSSIISATAFKPNESKLESQYVEKYTTPKKFSTMDMSHYFFPIFFSSEKGALQGVWDKQAGMGHVKRRVEMDGGHNFHILEICNPKQSTSTYIVAPKKEWMALHITLPHLVIVMKNFRRNFSFEVQVLDTRGFLRRFCLATWFNPSNLKKWPFLCQLPLKLEVGWNEIHLDFNDLLYRTYRTKFFEAVKIVVHANCRLRQIFFCGDSIINGELPIPSMRLFENLRLLNNSFGPFNHPNYYEQGSKHKTHHALLDPPADLPPSRLEKDLRALHIERFEELSKVKMKEPYRAHFKNLLVKSKAVIEYESEQKQNDDDKSPQQDDQGTSKSTINNELPEPTCQAISGIAIPPGLNGPISLQQLIQNALTHPTTSTPKTLSQYLEDMRMKHDRDVRF